MKGSRQRINILANSSGLNMLRPQEQSRLLYLCILLNGKNLWIDKLTMSKIGRELPQINNATAQSAVQAAQINVRDIFDEVNNSRNAFDESVKKLQ